MCGADGVTAHLGKGSRVRNPTIDVIKIMMPEVVPKASFPDTGFRAEAVRVPNALRII